MVSVNSTILRIGEAETAEEEKEKEAKKMTMVLETDFVYQEIKDMHSVEAWEKLEERWKRVQELTEVSFK